MDKYASYFIPTKGATTTAALISMLEADGYLLDHFALSRGYVPSKSPYLASYAGKFGTGYVLHIPNNETSGSRHSNNYHEIAYFIAL